MYTKRTDHLKLRNEQKPSEPDGKFMIGEVAKTTGSPIKTIRYYDEIGLLKPAEFTEGGRRLYTLEEIKRLELIRSLRYLNFGIEDIRKMLSGDTPIPKVIDWQIEDLYIQIRTIKGLKSMLQQTKQRTHKEDALNYMHDLVKSVSANTTERVKHFIEKMKALMIPADAPVEWREFIMFNLSRDVTRYRKLSALQMTALIELEELLDDPQFVQDQRYSISPIINMLQRPLYNTETWHRKYQQIDKRVFHAWDRQTPIDSPVMQEIVQDFTLMFANVSQYPLTSEFFHQFAEYAQKSVTSRTERFRMLCSILDPSIGPINKVNAYLIQGIQCKRLQLERE